MRIAVLCALAALTSGTAAAEPAEFFRKGPYLQNPGPGAITVAWEGEGVRAAELRILETGAVFRAEPAVRQELRVDGLEPGATYTYEVRAGAATARGELSAAPAADAPIRFAVFGNARQDERVRKVLAERVSAEAPDLVLGAGNLVSDGLSEHDWQRLFEDTRDLLADAPLLPALGRHDLQGAQRSADHVAEYFEVPDSAPQQGRYYALTYGPARFFALDSNLRDDAMEAQTAWLEAELAAAAADDAIRRIFAVTHHGPYSVGLNGGDARIRELWPPLFEEHGVDAVFSAHDHAYSRAEAGGVRYFVTGGGGAPLYRESRRDDASVDATRHFESAHHYLRVDVAHGVVDVSAVRLDGSIIETASWGAPRPPPADLQREIDAFLEPPPPAEPAAAPIARPAAPDRGPGSAPIGLGVAAFACLLAGGGAIAYSRRRA